MYSTAGASSTGSTGVSTSGCSTTSSTTGVSSTGFCGSSVPGCATCGAGSTTASSPDCSTGVFTSALDGFLPAVLLFFSGLITCVSVPGCTVDSTGRDVSSTSACGASVPGCTPALSEAVGSSSVESTGVSVPG